MAARRPAGEVGARRGILDYSEAVLTYLQAMGIRTRLRPLERAGFALLQGYGPRVAESGLGLVADYPWSAR